MTEIEKVRRRLEWWRDEDLGSMPSGKMKESIPALARDALAAIEEQRRMIIGIKLGRFTKEEREALVCADHCLKDWETRNIQLGDRRASEECSMHRATLHKMLER